MSNLALSHEDVASIVSQSIRKQNVYKGFTFRSPAVTILGGNCINQIGDALLELGARHILIVADKTVNKLGLVTACQDSIVMAGLKFTLFSEVCGEPDSDLIYQGVEILRQSQADFVLGIGGGSALDTAKGIAVIEDYKGPLSELKLGGISSRKVGLGAVPTTAGTGSEATDITVIKDLKNNIKVPIKGASLVPDIAVLDPNLMLGVPAHITAATGVDTLTHAIESYVSLHSNPLSKAYAYHAIETLITALPIAVGNGDNLDARYDMSVSAYKAGLAFSNSGLGLIHAIAHQIGARYDISHGDANAILLPYVMVFNSLTCEKEYAELAVALGVSRDSMTQRERCRVTIMAVRELIVDLGLPTSLANFNVNKQDFSKISKRAIQDICLMGNPRKVSRVQIEDLLDKVFEGTLPAGYQ
ncbi:iron-containing alcohol dehydrogenase family protein [Psychromonas hadalis]|uniref:iron-containing alcohol dehydrogenase family protein n=1 Tax=Psychromonas hadalis TaxID=211669 RepID=UPI0003B511F7|nr:iron-containing alcohol dehydrogenase [Psychromonas hadalis]